MNFILRTSEATAAHPQKISGMSCSQVVRGGCLSQDDGAAWIATPDPVLIHEYVAARIGGALQLMNTERAGVVAHIAMADKVEDIMTGRTTGLETWLTIDLGNDVTWEFIVREPILPPYIDFGAIRQFQAHLRRLWQLVGVPMELEWILDKDNNLFFLQLITLTDVDAVGPIPWVDQDAFLYLAQKV